MASFPQDKLPILNESSSQAMRTATSDFEAKFGFSPELTSCESSVVGPADLAVVIGASGWQAEFTFEAFPNSTQLLFTDAESAAQFAARHGEAETGTGDGPVDLIAALCGSYVASLAAAISLNFGELTVSSLPGAVPTNLAAADEVVTVEFALSVGDTTAIVTWSLESPVAEAIITAIELAAPDVAESGTSPFDQLASELVHMMEEDEHVPTPALVASNGSEPSDDPELGGLELLMDIPLEVTVELGRVKLPVRDVIDIGSGSIVELDKMAGEPVDVMVNRWLVARGEVVVIEDNFAVRITDIMSPAERLKRLGEREA